MSNSYNESNGGPAFPISIPGCGDNGAGGMTLRDYFAAKAMQSLIAKLPSMTCDHQDFEVAPRACAIGAYDYADAMLAARDTK